MRAPERLLMILNKPLDSADHYSLRLDEMDAHSINKIVVEKQLFLAIRISVKLSSPNMEGESI